MSRTDKHAEYGGKWRRAAKRAAAWFARMRSPEKTPEDGRRFRAWLTEDEGHAAAYDSIETAWDKAGDVKTLPGFRAMRREALRPRPTFRGHRLQGAGRNAGQARSEGLAGRSIAAAIAAVLVMTVTGLGLGMSLRIGGEPAQSYRTAAGQRTSMTLADGSLVTLASDSALKVAFSKRARRIVLLRGQAYFDVARDPGRPFRVEAGSGTVTALGTEFDVYNNDGEVKVTLVEGRVAVAAPDRPQAESRAVRRLEAGEGVSYGESGMGQVREVDIARVISWRKGRMVVTNEPLLNVIDELNRHSERKLKVDRSDPRLRKLLVTGQFTTGRPEVIVEYLRSAGIRVWVTKDSDGNISMRLGGGRSHG